MLDEVLRYVAYLNPAVALFLGQNISLQLLLLPPTDVRTFVPQTKPDALSKQAGRAQKN
jgi:hypothetical protein